MLFGFDPFGNHLALERLAQANDGLDDGKILRVGEHVADEGAIDLQRIGGAAQIGERE